jgi:hypothetical protein
MAKEIETKLKQMFFHVFSSIPPQEQGTKALKFKIRYICCKHYHKHVSSIKIRLAYALYAAIQNAIINSEGTAMGSSLQSHQYW